MQQFETPDIKRRPDGSIDTAHYMEIGHQKRAEQAEMIAKGVLSKGKVFSLSFWSLGLIGT